MTTIEGSENMSVKIEHGEDIVTAYLSGEIDHHSAKAMREKIDMAAGQAKPKSLILDFSAVGFMDSSGIGLVMGRYKFMRDIGGTVTVQNPSAPIKKVMRLAGLDRIAKFKELQIK